ncbi:MAG: hypothetical protein QW244_01210 [Candidatus Pacearchaeota archaeon]
MIYLLCDTNHSCKEIQKEISIKIEEIINSNQNKHIVFFTELFRPNEDIDDIFLNKFRESAEGKEYFEILNVLKKKKYDCNNEKIKIFGILPQLDYFLLGYHKPFYDNFEKAFKKYTKLCPNPVSIIHIGDAHRDYFINEFNKNKIIDYCCYVFEKDLLGVSISLL